MFFIIPIGSEEGVRRLPYLTIGLIAINTIIWIITGSILISQTSELENLGRQLYEIEIMYAHKIVQEDPGFLAKATTEDIHERIAQGDLIPADSHDAEQWQKLYNEYKEKSSHMVFEQLGFIPKKFEPLKIFTSMFVHANLFHLLFNMLFLWLVGCNIEDDWSWKVFLGLYLVCGAVAVLFHDLAYPQSNTPLIGASGAIAGIMGAFMIRHYKTKIRFAYFILIIFRPFFGTFSVYAAIALPIWFLQQILGASWSMEGTGTAYWAHIGGFVFGAIVSASLRAFGVEKKYIEPMVEDSFEKLKMSPPMKEVYKRLDAGDNASVVPLLLPILNEEPENFDAPLILARIDSGKGHHDDALLMYNRALEIILRNQNVELAPALYEELKDKNILGKIAEKHIYNLAALLEKANKFEESAQIYGLYINLFPQSKLRPKAIFRTYVLFRDKLNSNIMAEGAHAFLVKEYPNWIPPEQSPGSV